MARQVVTEGIVILSRMVGISQRSSNLRFRAHRTDCRYADNPDAYPMAEMIEVYGHDSVRTKIFVGIVEPCKVCSPVLLTEQEA